MAFRGVTYALYIVCITPLFILITELVNRGGVLSPELGGLRMLDNLVGAAIGMAGRLRKQTHTTRACPHLGD
jgi:hypothetical protein